MRVLNQDFVLFATVHLCNLCYVNGACALMSELESKRWQLVSLASSQPTIQFSYQSLEKKGKKHVSHCLWHENMKGSSLQGHLRLFYIMTRGYKVI